MTLTRMRVLNRQRGRELSQEPTKIDNLVLEDSAQFFSALKQQVPFMEARMKNRLNNQYKPKFNQR